MAIDAVLVGEGNTTDTAASGTTAAGTSVGGSGRHGVLAVTFDPSSSIVSVTDSKGNTWSQLREITGAQGEKIAVWTTANWTGGASHTVTVTWDIFQSYSTMTVVEVSGALTASFVDVDTDGTDATGEPYELASGALAQADEVLLCICTNNSGGDGAYTSSNFTILSSESSVSTYWTQGVGKLVVASTSSVTASFARSAAGSGSAKLWIISFKAATAGSILRQMIAHHE